MAQLLQLLALGVAQLPCSSNRCAEAFGYSISGWSMGLLRMRLTMLAAAGRLGQVWFWAARQAIAPAGIPSGVGVPPQSPPISRADG
ncbi:hypothetical protein [Cyanobium sp. ULC084]